MDYPQDVLTRALGLCHWRFGEGLRAPERRGRIAHRTAMACIVLEALEALED